MDAGAIAEVGCGKRGLAAALQPPSCSRLDLLYWHIGFLDPVWADQRISRQCLIPIVLRIMVLPMAFEITFTTAWATVDELQTTFL